MNKTEMKPFNGMTADRLGKLFQAFASLRIAVLGDFFLDKYLDVDPALAEYSIETGKTAHQVVGIRKSPGAAGTVVGNLAALRGGVISDGECGVVTSEVRLALAERAHRFPNVVFWADSRRRTGRSRIGGQSGCVDHRGAIGRDRHGKPPAGRRTIANVAETTRLLNVNRYNQNGVMQNGTR
jgi:hypothetical protein